MKFYHATDIVKPFVGKKNWYCIELNETISNKIEPLIKEMYPKTLKCKFRLDHTKWSSSIMRNKNKKLCIALPIKVRKEADIKVGQKVTIHFKLK